MSINDTIRKLNLLGEMVLDNNDFGIISISKNDGAKCYLIDDNGQIKQHTDTFYRFLVLKNFIILANELRVIAIYARNLCNSIQYAEFNITMLQRGVVEGVNSVKTEVSYNIYNAEVIGMKITSQRVMLINYKGDKLLFDISTLFSTITITYSAVSESYTVYGSTTASTEKDELLIITKDLEILENRYVRNIFRGKYSKEYGMRMVE